MIGRNESKTVVGRVRDNCVCMRACMFESVSEVCGPVRFL